MGGGYGGGGYGGGGYGGGARAGGAAPRTGYKVRITGLPEGMRWSELKDFVRKAGDVTYADVRGDEGWVTFQIFCFTICFWCLHSTSAFSVPRVARVLPWNSFLDRRLGIGLVLNSVMVLVYWYTTHLVAYQACYSSTSCSFTSAVS